MFYFYQMRGQFLLLFFLANIPFFAQTVSKNKILFNENTSITSFSFLKENPLMIEYQKYCFSNESFSIYNPKPGFNPTIIETQKYYSFTNTRLLLKREMQNREPEPIFPDQNKKKTLGEAILYDVLDNIFSKK